MHLKNPNNRPLLIALALLLPCILLSATILSVSMTPPSLGSSHSSVAETYVPVASDAANMGHSGGVHQDEGKNNEIVKMQGTGISPLAIWSGRH